MAEDIRYAARVVILDPSGNIIGSFGGGGSGGAGSIADGADVAQGSTTDPAGANTVLGQLKALEQVAASQSPVNVILDPTGKGQQPAAGSLSMVPATAKKQLGSLSAIGDVVAIAVDGYATATLQLAALTGSPSGAAVIEATQDAAATWFPINMTPVAAGGTPTPVSTLAPGTTAQNFETAAGSFDQVRVRCTAAFSTAQPVVLGAYTGGKSLRAGLLPGENHVGEVGGSAAKVSATFGPSSSTTYTAGQVLMATTAFAGMARVANGMGYLFGATLGLNVANAAQVDLFVFSSPPSGNYTAGTTFALAAADLPKLSKVIHLDDWTAAGAALSFGQPLDKGPRVIRCDDGTAATSLWLVAVARGSITLASAMDAVLTLRPARN